MQHYGVNGYSLHAMNSLSAMYNLHQQAAQQAQHAPDYRPSVHALTLAERLAGNNQLLFVFFFFFFPPFFDLSGRNVSLGRRDVLPPLAGSDFN